MVVRKLSMNMFTDGEDIYVLGDYICVLTSDGSYGTHCKGAILEMDEGSFIVGVNGSRTNCMRIWYKEVQNIQLVRRGEEYSNYHIAAQYAAFAKNTATGQYIQLPLRPQENQMLIENRTKEAIDKGLIPRGFNTQDIRIRKRFEISYIFPWEDAGELTVSA